MTDTIPEDIRETAQSLIDNYGFDPEGLLCGAIKAALLSERRRAQSEERERIEQLEQGIAALTRALAVRNEALERWENGGH